MFKFNPVSASKHLEKSIPLGPNGIAQRAFIECLVLFALVIALTVAMKLLVPTSYERFNAVLHDIRMAPFFWLLYRLAMGIWTYLFRLASYVQTLRDFAVPNIAHMRVRIADLTPQRPPSDAEESPPTPAECVPRPSAADAESLRTRERNTLVALIGVLCKEQGINCQRPAAAAATLKSMTAAHGLSIGESTIESVMKKVPEAIEARSR
ncbi:hypothetical protein PFX98_17825 [Paucibacter sediminis]|uniref:Uncharacterized protein n=1 Tax=Paucibacter sediminis TaxID=3019553 RepID=A0AA95SUN6_9BURK|nr:hypothetical protein [Paucibacter sp. S2-9]WIT10759.1 hypothetical protein PFX98_17825 [Paucibacter sp. S2-9]